MEHDEFRTTMDRCGVTFPLLRRLTGLSRSGAYGMGRDFPVAQYAVTIMEAWYLMDGPKRQELLKAIGR